MPSLRIEIMKLSAKRVVFPSSVKYPQRTVWSGPVLSYSIAGGAPRFFEAAPASFASLDVLLKKWAD